MSNFQPNNPDAHAREERHHGQPQQSGLVAGHAQYIKGAVESAIGSVTGSQPWTASGEQDKAAAAHAMREAAAHREVHERSKAEEVMGKAVGCEGMVREGRGVNASGQSD